MFCPGPHGLTFLPLSFHQSKSQDQSRSRVAWLSHCQGHRPGMWWMIQLDKAAYPTLPLPWWIFIRNPTNQQVLPLALETVNWPTEIDFKRLYWSSGEWRYLFHDHTGSKKKRCSWFSTVSEFTNKFTWSLIALAAISMFSWFPLITCHLHTQILLFYP